MEIEPLASGSSPSLPEKQSVMGKSSYIAKAIILSSIGIPQIVAPFVLVAKTISSLWNLSKFAIIFVQIQKLQGRIRSLQLQGTSEDRIQAKQDALNTLEGLLSFEKARQEETIDVLTKNAHSFVIATLAMIPFFGLLAGGAYAHAVDAKGLSLGTGIERGTEAIGQFLFGQIPGIEWAAKKVLFPLTFGLGRSLSANFKTREELNKQSAQDQLTKFRETKVVPNTQNLKAFLNDEEAFTAALDKYPLLEGITHSDKVLLEFLATFEDIRRKKKQEKEGFKESLISIERGDKKPHFLTCLQRQAQPFDPAAKTMVLFGGTGMVAHHMKREAQWYNDRGWNVLLMTIGGYPGSGDEHISTSEATTIQDLAGVIGHLEKEKVKTIGVQGFCLGGSLAMHSQRFSDAVQLIVVDKPLDSASRVLANQFENTRKTLPKICRMIPSSFIRGLTRTAIPSGVVVPGVLDKKGNPFLTSGYTLHEDVQAFSGTLVGIGGNKDEKLGYSEKGGFFRKMMTQDLLEEHRAQGKGQSLFITGEGVGHVPTCFDENAHQDPEGARAQALIEQGILPFATFSEKIVLFKSLDKKFLFLHQAQRQIIDRQMMDFLTGETTATIEQKADIVVLLARNLRTLSDKDCQALFGKNKAAVEGFLAQYRR